MAHFTLSIITMYYIVTKQQIAWWSSCSFVWIAYLINQVCILSLLMFKQWTQKVCSRRLAVKEPPMLVVVYHDAMTQRARHDRCRLNNRQRLWDHVWLDIWPTRCLLCLEFVLSRFWHFFQCHILQDNREKHPVVVQLSWKKPENTLKLQNTLHTSTACFQLSFVAFVGRMILSRPCICLFVTRMYGY